MSADNERVVVTGLGVVAPNGTSLGEFEVAWVRVRVNKPGAIRGARDVGILIERGEAPGAS